MKYILYSLIGAIALFNLSCGSKKGSNPTPPTDPLKVDTTKVAPGLNIILRFDDLGSIKNTTPFPLLDYLVTRKIPAGLGVIGIRLDGTAKDVYKKYLEATDSTGNALFEIWDHGYDHSKNNPPGDTSLEFFGTSYAFQLDHFKRSNSVVKDRLGIQMHTFGTPYNRNDTVFNRVITTNSNFKVFMFNYTELPVPGVLSLNNRVDMEHDAGVVSYDYFMLQFQKYKGTYRDYMILQGHPLSWTPARLAEFDKIVNYLVAQKCRFILPYDYYKAHKP